ncbi:MAG: 16S rRNA (uracil(1498)-N(3))-methyltransferase [Eubacteriales bacterium]|nr:16S rRNA (uracil(1498)-N(3))-methyltransferase [Eubacteriales bacterium]
MQRFFAQPHEILLERGEIHIGGGDVNHMKNVLRMKKGDEVWISGGGNQEYRCTLLGFEREEALLQIQEARKADYELKSRIYLFQGLPKGDKMELIIQKAVELGAYAIVPVETKRCVVRLDPKKSEKKAARWQQISESAAKQSKRMLVPQVFPVMTYQKALAMAGDLDLLLIPYENAEGMQRTRALLESVHPGQSVGIFIGPEGGFEEAEVELAREAGAKAVTLGKRILRTETAGLAVLSALMLLLEAAAEEGA